MKHLTIAALIVLSAGAASAAPFGYQQQVGSSELDPSIWEGTAATARTLTSSSLSPSLFVPYPGVDIDGSAEFAHMGQIVPGGASVTSGCEQAMN
ncbi:MAG: hypothetical protein WBM65_06615 [Sedimenticolaceae bacterium]